MRSLIDPIGHHNLTAHLSPSTREIPASSTPRNSNLSDPRRHQRYHGKHRPSCNPHTPPILAEATCSSDPASLNRNVKRLTQHSATPGTIYVHKSPALVTDESPSKYPGPPDFPQASERSKIGSLGPALQSQRSAAVLQPLP